MERWLQNGILIDQAFLFYSNKKQTALFKIADRVSLVWVAWLRYKLFDDGSKFMKLKCKQKGDFEKHQTLWSQSCCDLHARQWQFRYWFLSRWSNESDGIEKSYDDTDSSNTLPEFNQHRNPGFHNDVRILRDCKELDFFQFFLTAILSTPL